MKLYEELFLLTIHDEKGSVVSSVQEVLPVALSSGILGELALLGRLSVDPKGRLLVEDPTPTGDEILDSALEKIQTLDHPKKIPFWIGEIVERPKRLREAVMDSLTHQGVVKQEDNRIVWVIPYEGAPEQNASVKYWVKNRLRTLALTCQEYDLRTLASLCLAQAAGLNELVFTKDERKAAQHRVYELLIGEAMRNNVAQTIEEIKAATESLLEQD